MNDSMKMLKNGEKNRNLRLNKHKNVILFYFIDTTIHRIIYIRKETIEIFFFVLVFLKIRV